MIFLFQGNVNGKKTLRKLNFHENSRGRQKILPTAGDEGGTSEKGPRTADPKGGETACSGSR